MAFHKVEVWKFAQSDEDWDVTVECGMSPFVLTCALSLGSSVSSVFTFCACQALGEAAVGINTLGHQRM